MIFVCAEMFDDENDRERFITMYEKYCSTMCNIAFGIVKGKNLAEDIVHDAFIKLAFSMHRLKHLTENEMKAYLMVITRNCALTLINKLKREQKCDIEIENIAFSQTDLVEARFEDKSSAKNIMDLIKNKLSNSLADVLLLKIKFGLSNKMIAKVLDIRPNTVAQRLRRARKEIAEILKSEEDKE